MNLPRKKNTHTKKGKGSSHSVCQGEEESLGVSAGLQDQGEGCSLTKGTYLLLFSAWLALALEFHYLPGMSLLNPALGYGRQPASAPVLQPKPDGDVRGGE